MKPTCFGLVDVGDLGATTMLQSSVLRTSTVLLFSKLSKKWSKVFSDISCSHSYYFTGIPHMFLPDTIASVFSSSWASFPIQTNTWKYFKHSVPALFHGIDCTLKIHTVLLTYSRLWFLYLLPGVKDHDIISGKIVLGHLPRYLLNLRGREGFSRAILMHCVRKGL